VRLASGQPGLFQLVALESNSLHYATSQGSISFPADGDEVIALGAVNDAGQRLSYSSCGPNSPRPKPDFVAPVPFPVDRVQPFGGTSAASPQAAALAALWFSRHPEWMADQVHAAMKSSAHDLGPKNYDFETGFGLIGMPKP
jgi:subtilisin family serine protease